MNIEKFLEALTPNELSAVLAGALQRTLTGPMEWTSSYQIRTSSGALMGNFIPIEKTVELDEESPEFLAELEKRMEYDGPTMTGDEALTLLEMRWGKLRPESAEGLDSNGSALDHVESGERVPVE